MKYINICLSGLMAFAALVQAFSYHNHYNLIIFGYCLSFAIIFFLFYMVDDLKQENFNLKKNIFKK